MNKKDKVALLMKATIDYVRPHNGNDYACKEGYKTTGEPKLPCTLTKPKTKPTITRPVYNTHSVY
jgi:hypothetical protein